MRAKSLIVRRVRLAVAIGTLTSCANLIGLDDYEKNDDPVREADGNQGEGGVGGAAGSVGSDGGLGGASHGAGEAGALGTGGVGSGGETSAAVGGEGGTEEPPAVTGGRRSSGGERGLGGSSSGGTATGGSESETGGTATGGTATGGAPATGGNPSTGGQGPTSCTLAGLPQACRACVDQNCDAYCDPCLDDASCSALTQCLQDCSGSECLDQCFEAHPQSAGDDFLDVYASCGFTTCAESCGQPFGAECDEDSECAGGYCSGPGGHCTDLCDDHEGCPDSALCAADYDGINKCLLFCDSGLDCPAGHDCGYVSTVDDFAELLCTTFPALSAPCTSDLDCHSGHCSSAAGFCNNTCLDDWSCAEDASCAYDSSDEPHCLLDCVDSLDCSSYAGSTCSAELGYDFAVPEDEWEPIDVCLQ